MIKLERDNNNSNSAGGKPLSTGQGQRYADRGGIGER